MNRAASLLLCLALACVGWFWPAQRAEAACVQQDSGGRNWIHCADPSEAYAKANSYNPAPDSTVAGYCAVSTGVTHDVYQSQPLSTGVPGVYTYRFHCGNSGWFGWASASFDSACPPGTPWDEASHTCKPPFDSSQCLAHNAEDGFKNVGDTVRSFECANVGGCEFKAVGPHVGVTLGTQQLWEGHYEFTGNPGSACTTNKPATDPSMDDAKQDKQQDCVPAGSGQTFCIKSDGEHCASAGSGKEVCWRPGETGEKNSDNYRQKRDPGTDPKPPTPPTNGDTLTKTGDTITTTTTTDGRTFTTNITNYVTGSGSDAGNTDDGQPADGTGDKKGDGSASGGAGCEAPPVCSGDAVNCAVLDQAWRIRCGTNNHKLTDNGCNAGAPVAFACSGDEIMCKQALLAEEAKCKAEKAQGDIAADNASDDGDSDGFALGSLWKTGTGSSLDGSVLSFGGSANDLFPQVELAPGQVFKTPDALPNLLSMIRLLVIAGFMIWAVGVAGGTE